MTDAHYHRSGGTFLRIGAREFAFAGTHPWQAELHDAAGLRRSLESDPALGVGEIGLDRLRSKTVSDVQRAVFRGQLELAAEFRRPVVLHGAKCWGQVVKECAPFAGVIPAFLFHGFSRSDGLLPDIAALNGFIGVGKAVLNDHAVNYRELVKKIPRDRLLAETDSDPDFPDGDGDAVTVADVIGKIAELTGTDGAILAANAGKFIAVLSDAAERKEIG